MASPTTVYPAFLASPAHPDRMAVRARLRGIASPSPDRCRVLELGCAAGWSLLAFGYALPGSEFIGIDLAGPAIEQGNGWVARLGLKNVHLRAGDVMEFGEGEGEFDYIFAHGLLSWVPEPVRRKIFDILGSHLAPNGVAYLSYNTYPGGHMRDMLRGMMRFHTRNLTADADRMAQSRGLLGALLEPPVPDTPYHHHLARVAERMSVAPPEQILFDELADENHHYYFHEFATLASRHGFEFLAEADLADLGSTLPPNTQAVLARIGDRLTREQYLDFFVGRAFRQTLLCRPGLQRQPDDAEVVRGLWIGGPMERADESGHRWTGLDGGAVNTSHPGAQAAFTRMGEAWPRLMEGAELLGSPAPAELAHILVRCIEAGILRAHIAPPPAVPAAGERPRASRLAQAQIGQLYVPSLACEAIELSNEADEKLLALLDGSLSRSELQGRLGMNADELEANLRRLARLELIEQ